MRWEEFEREVAGLAGVVRPRFEEPGLVLLVTLRRDGSPRLSPVEPLFWAGELWLSCMWRSTKAADLRRDDRVLVHSIVTRREGDEGDVKLRGRAVPVEDEHTMDAFAEQVRSRLGWLPAKGRFHLFRVEVDEVAVLRYEDGDQHVMQWPPGRSYVRRATSDTSVGDPEDVSVF
jgi:hypothetical protein